jgi:Zn-dependent protease
MLELSNVQKLILVAIPLVLGIVFHEVAHGWVANKLGDPTARMLGRLSLNPLKHIDPMFTLILPLLTFYFTGIAFGGAKPIPVTAQNFRNPRKGMAIVAAAGPLANGLMACCWLGVAWAATYLSQSTPQLAPFVYMGVAGLQINLMLAVFNLVPIPPLDGSRVIVPFLPRAGVRFMDWIEPYGLFIIFGLIFLINRGIL